MLAGRKANMSGLLWRMPEDIDIAEGAQDSLKTLLTNRKR